MQLLDRLFQEWRFRAIQRYIRPGARVLDIGCGDGALFRRFPDRIREGIGIDADLREPVEGGAYRLLPGMFPDDLPTSLGGFDVITMLAVLEHIPPGRQPHLAHRCTSLLTSGGRVILTVPSPKVDHILHGLKHLPFLYEGRSLEQHYGFDPNQTPRLFPSLRLLVARRFEFGLNHLFVFERVLNVAD